MGPGDFFGGGAKWNDANLPQDDKTPAWNWKQKP